jgi:Carboxypeptidase regulatory-like domain
MALALALLVISPMRKPAARPFSMRRLALHSALATSVLVGTGCHPKTTVVTTTSAAIGGTIAGVVYGPADASLSDRNVSVVNIETGERFQTTTGPNGGYSMRVPPGTYRLEVQLRNREKISDDTPTVLISADAATGKTVDVNVGP